METNYFVESITDLFNELSKSEDIKHKISLKDAVISIMFHNNFKIEITANKMGLFNVYINSVFYSEVENQDITPLILEITNALVIIQLRKPLLFRRTFTIISKNKFNKNDWIKKSNILVFTSTETLISNY